MSSLISCHTERSEVSLKQVHFEILPTLRFVGMTALWLFSNSVSFVKSTLFVFIDKIIGIKKAPGGAGSFSIIFRFIT